MKNFFPPSAATPIDEEDKKEVLSQMESAFQTLSETIKQGGRDVLQQISESLSPSEEFQAAHAKISALEPQDGQAEDLRTQALAGWSQYQGSLQNLQTRWEESIQQFDAIAPEGYYQKAAEVLDRVYGETLKDITGAETVGDVQSSVGVFQAALAEEMQETFGAELMMKMHAAKEEENRAMTPLLEQTVQGVLSFMDAAEALEVLSEEDSDSWASGLEALEKVLFGQAQ